MSRSMQVRLRLLGLLSCCLIVATNGARASGPRDSMIASPEWLLQHLKDPDVVVLQVGPRATYDAGHIPGARSLTMYDVSAPEGHGGLSTELPDPEALRTTLQRLGISDRSRIIVYAAGTPPPIVTRVILTLQFAGLGANAAFLQGGLAAWTKAGGEVTTVVAPITPGVLSPLKTVSLVVDAAFVQKNAGTPGIAVVDGRSRASYEGVPPANKQNTDPLGHIPGALSVPFNTVFDENGALRSSEELEVAFANAGVKPGDTVVGYCWVGQQATTMLFAARALGHPIKLYDGSIEDWGNRKLPLEVVKK